MWHFPDATSCIASTDRVHGGAFYNQQITSAEHGIKIPTQKNNFTCSTMFSALIRKTEENPCFSGKILKCFNSFLASFSINKLGNNKYANETYFELVLYNTYDTFFFHEAAKLLS